MTTETEKQAIDCLRRMQEVTKVLGSGIGGICTPDGFFKLWNETECEASVLIHAYDASRQPVGPNDEKTESQNG